MPSPKLSHAPDRRQRDGRRAGVHGQDGLEMLDDVGVQAADHAEIVGQRPRLGNRSLIHRPDSPHWRKRNGEPMSGRLPVSSLRKPKEGTGSP